MKSGAEKRGRLIKQLEDALILSEELNDPRHAILSFGCLSGADTVQRLKFTVGIGA
jgi:hypothetical protein